VGPVTAGRLRAHGIERLVDVRTVPPATLQAAVGSQAGWLTALAWGRDDRRVISHRVAKSNGAERTYTEDLRDVAEMHGQIDRLSRLCGEWVERKALRARTVTLKVRYADFTTVTRSLSVAGGVGDIASIAEHAHQLLERTEAATRPVRLLGVSVHNLSDPSATSIRGDDVLPFDGPDEVANDAGSETGHASADAPH
ncbi:MAG TPA: DUF488 family protein, partial [Luteitalea sp.]|nr:DUF488 family protein [Luteitalea sp.]